MTTSGPGPGPTEPPGDVPALAAALVDRAYLPDRGLATALHLALWLPRPLLLEGDAGVGKTEAAKVLAEVLGARLIRLQCHEGIDRSQALYAWDHPRQLLHLRALEASGERPADHEDELYSERFLLARPLLQALQLGRRAVLLIDEIDRADDEFEAFLLELLSDFQVSVPELGTIRAPEPPVVLLTSNRTRELSDALKRRCLYHWIEHPDVERETAIVRARAPDVPPEVVERVVALVARLRGLGLYKPPGIAETIDWARVLAAVPGPDRTRPDQIDHDRSAHGPLGPDRGALLDSLGVVVKDHDDLVTVRRMLDELAPP